MPFSASPALLDQFATVSQLGNSETFERAAPAGKSLCRVNVDLAYAQAWVITLNPPSRGGIVNASRDVRGVFARIVWGNGGNSSTAEIDWRQGSQLCVYGSFVDVFAVVPEDPNPGPLTLGANLTPGVVSNGFSKPTRTISAMLAPDTVLDNDVPLPDLPTDSEIPLPGQSLSSYDLVPLPPFARCVRVLLAELDGFDLDLEFRAGEVDDPPRESSLLAVVSFEGDAANELRPIDIPPGTTHIAVRGPVGARGLPLKLIFELAL